MTRDDIRKLIGGYATGTLTESERRILFEAAVDDQELFDELAREQALKETLEEPGAKTRLISALAEPSPVPRPAWWKTPITWVGAALAAAAVLALMIVRQPHPSQYAQVRTEAPPPAPSAAPQTAPPSNEPVQPKEAPAASPAGLAQPAAALAKKSEPAKDLDASKNAELKAKSEAKEADTALAEPAAAASAEKAERSEKRDTQEDTKSAQFTAQAPSAGAPAPPAPQPVSGFRQLSEPAQQQAANQQQQAQSGPAQNRRAPAAAAGRAGGVVGGAPAFLAARPHFAFDYSIEPGRELVIKPTANGYLSVSATESKSRIFPASGERAVAAGSITRIPIPADVQTVTIVFSASPGDAADQISSVKDPPAGTVEDPNPSPNSRLVIELKIQP